jgi:hypothetical protein
MSARSPVTRTIAEPLSWASTIAFWAATLSSRSLISSLCSAAYDVVM